jgi:hypothetical protein
MKYLNIQFILLFVLSDVLAFPRRDNKGFFWRLLFDYFTGSNDKKLYYIYRPLQFLLGAVGLYFTFTIDGWIAAAAYLLAFILLVTDLWYYIFNLELSELLGFERKKIDTYWLEHFYQIGHYTWAAKYPGYFSLKQFLIFSILGTVLLIISNLI